MNKRHFIKSLGLGSLALMQPGLTSRAGILPVTAAPEKVQHRVWINPDHKDTAAELKVRYRSYRQAGIGVIYFEEDSLLHFSAAKEAGIAAHRWFWTMNRGDKDLLANHPEWYSENRKGESCATNPPYVNYYRFLCPNKEAVVAHLRGQAEQILSKDYVDGLHLDYIRFVDVVLPVNLWAQYGIDQSRELPEYDFCYCNACRTKYKAAYGTDPMDMAHPDQSPSWRKFRYDSITHVVSNMAEVARAHRKPITAAVFPTPEIAKRIVRQDWVNWPLDAICPMIYHGFYKESVKWIGDAVAEGVHALHGAFPLYAGLFLPDFKGDAAQIREGVQLAVENGAAGVSVFGSLTPEVLKILQETAG
ncbi:Tat pathway signal protein [Chitinophaga sp. XS-30]|uniref:Tat pathway signal protein n=1 Tax=Chitinophaga sp. XS-30 TaxID=2604421 RepID=UPI0011DE05AC|nr:Tat pathway signal protein [Chitinophaga sp. XS-30]QEH41649.1 Tat pathway signal protein [Chitinophaga sp. XS-30]